MSVGVTIIDRLQLSPEFDKKCSIEGHNHFAQEFFCYNLCIFSKSYSYYLLSLYFIFNFPSAFRKTIISELHFTSLHFNKFGITNTYCMYSLRRHPFYTLANPFLPHSILRIP